MAEVAGKFLPLRELTNFTADIFEKLGVPRKDAEITAENLISADRRGIASHGLARLARYVDGIKEGVIKANAKMKIINETPTTILVSGEDGLGQPVSHYTMEKVIEKAKKNGTAFASVKDSNHFGIAGYYAIMALQHNLIGISMTNSAPLVVPTFGCDMIIGTNPIAVAVPTKKHRPWVLDMATSTVPRGKLEVYARRDKKMPLMWATDEHGIPNEDPKLVLDNLINRRGGGLLPLGGGEELTGGHKGYGLSMMIDIFCGVLSGGSFGLEVYGHGKDKPADVCHFFGAIDPSAFTPLDEFKQKMDDSIDQLKNSPKAKGQEKIYYAGEKEWDFEEKYKDNVEIEAKVIDGMKKIAEGLGIKFPF